MTAAAVSEGDLTRWNRAGLKRFRYVDGNAATHLEELRLALLSRFLADKPAPGPDPGRDVEWWRRIWADPPAVDSAADPAARRELDELLAEIRARLRWTGEGSDPGPLWVQVPPRKEAEEALAGRLLGQYQAPRGELGWELVRSFSRSVHLVTEHLEAYANEGFLGTATQWESVRRLAAMLDARPAPPASAATTLLLLAGDGSRGSRGSRGKVAKGFQVKHSPEDGSAPVVFETLEDLEIDAALNELRPAGFDRSPEAVQGARLTLAGRVKGLRTGEPLILEDEDRGHFHGYVIQGVLEGDAETVVDVAPPVAAGLVRGSTLVHAAPREHLALLGPGSVAAHVGRGLQLTEEPEGLQPGEVVWIGDGRASVFRRVERVQGLRLALDAEVGDLRVDRAAVGRPVVLPVTAVAGRSVAQSPHPPGPPLPPPLAPTPGEGGIPLASAERGRPSPGEGGRGGGRGDGGEGLRVAAAAAGPVDVIVVKAAGDWTRLIGGTVADLWPVAGGGTRLVSCEVFAVDFRPVGSGAPDAGYSFLKLSWSHDGPGTLNPQALFAPPPGGGTWRTDRFLVEASSRVPLAIATTLPKKVAAGDLAAVVSGGRIAWSRLGAVEVDPDGSRAAQATLSAEDRWRDRGGGPFFFAGTAVYGRFERRARLAGWDRNDRPLAGTRVPLAAVPPGLRNGRVVFLRRDGLPGFPGLPGVGVVTKVGEVRSDSIVLEAALPAGSTYGNLILCGNAVAAGHGEAREEKVLGSGDAAQSGQVFVFAERGISFVADANQPAGVRADVEVRVGDRVWQQVPTLADSGPADPHFAVRMTEDGGLELTFGDGRNGRRLPTGTNNVRIAWRVGTGLGGNLPPGRLEKPSQPHPLVAAVRQPLSATGGNDMEGVESLRTTAPANVSTLGRAVSLADFGRLAESQSSVWQARAFPHRAPFGRQESVRVVVVPAGGGPLEGLAASLPAFLEAHSLPGVSVQVDPYVSKPVSLRVTLLIETAEFDPDRVLAGVRESLLSTFGLRARKMGQALRLGEIYRVVEQVSGVSSSLAVLEGDPSRNQVAAPPDGVVHLDAEQSSLIVTYQEHEL